MVGDQEAATDASDLSSLAAATDGPIAVAVSGGADSLALLLLAHWAFPDRVRALTVDHGLRPESADEAAAVAGICATLGIPHAILRWDDATPGGDLQARAREARYRLMGEWCEANGVGVLATAHHADDQAETLLMRLARGSGAGGLAGIRASRTIAPGVTLVRPLLDLRRATLARIVADAGLTPVDDPSNRDPRFDRTAARALLAETPWLDPARLAASAAHLADAEAALDWVAEAAWRGRATVATDTTTLDPHGLPHAIVRRLVLRAVGGSPRGDSVERLIATLHAGGTATLAGVRASGGETWRFAPARPRRGHPPRGSRD